MLQRAELIAAVERLQVVAKSGDNVIKFDLDARNKALLVSAFAVGFGQVFSLLAFLLQSTESDEFWSGEGASGVRAAGRTRRRALCHWYSIYLLY